jgi:hypothetical protein
LSKIPDGRVVSCVSPIILQNDGPDALSASQREHFALNGSDHDQRNGKAGQMLCPQRHDHVGNCKLTGF